VLTCFQRSTRPPVAALIQVCLTSLQVTGPTSHWQSDKHAPVSPPIGKASLLSLVPRHFMTPSTLTSHGATRCRVTCTAHMERLVSTQLRVRLKSPSPFFSLSFLSSRQPPSPSPTSSTSPSPQHETGRFIRHPPSLPSDNDDTTAFLSTSLSRLRPRGTFSWCSSLTVFSLGLASGSRTTVCALAPSWNSNPFHFFTLPVHPYRSHHLLTCPQRRRLKHPLAHSPMAMSAPVPLGAHTNLRLPPNHTTPQVSQSWLLQPCW